MAGIMANSASKTMLAGATSADNSVSGYITNEQITLSVTPTGSAYVWGLAKPSGSTARSVLSSSTGATPLVTPDVAGYYTVTCVVDSTTTYVLRISVAAVSITTIAQAFRCQPVANSTVPTPSTGESLYFSDDVDRLVVKTSAGVVREVDPGARTGTFTLSSGAATITDSSVTAATIVAANCTSASSRGTLTYTITPGTSIAVASSDGADASVYLYALIG
jgi:hypothetical protein